ncbi:MAG: hypothetical protein R2932_24140 [Caldilineaceae bacterium]
MGKRHNSIGIKQTVRLEWMQKTVNLLLAGLDEVTVRQELHEYLHERKGSGIRGDRSSEARSFAVTNLMRIWVTPDPELVPLRDAALASIRTDPAVSMAAYWAMISAAYPFWFNVARQTGRLLNLQNQVTHAQIVHRLKEQYGDRQTVSRNTQFVIRSFIAWDVLKDSPATGCYEKTKPLIISDRNLTLQLLESALQAMPEGKATLSMLLNAPAFFPFQLPAITGDFIGQNAERVQVARYGLDEEMLKLREGY